MTPTSTLHTTRAGHRSMSSPRPRRMSAPALLAAVSDLETAGMLTEYEAARARGRVTKGN